MTVLQIRDLSDGSLAFDLRHLLRLLAPPADTALWRVRTPQRQAFEASGSGGAALEDLAAAEAPAMAGADLLVLADNTAQVIWGDFIGSLTTAPDVPWLTLRAVDSSFWEVETADDTAVARLRDRFRDVRTIAATA